MGRQQRLQPHPFTIHQVMPFQPVLIHGAIKADKPTKIYGTRPSAAGSMAKLADTDLTKRYAALAIDILGEAGIATDQADHVQLAIAQEYLSAPRASIAGGTDQIQRSIIGERVLGLPKEPRVPAERPKSGRE